MVATHGTARDRRVGGVGLCGDRRQGHGPRRERRAPRAGAAAAAPGTEPFQALVERGPRRASPATRGGKNADYIPILATIPSELFGVAIATRDGRVYTAGDVDYRFSIQSVSKPFTAALVMQQYGGPEIIAEKIGVEPTGLAVQLEARARDLQGAAR